MYIRCAARFASKHVEGDLSSLNNSGVLHNYDSIDGNLTSIQERYTMFARFVLSSLKALSRLPMPAAMFASMVSLLWAGTAMASPTPASTASPAAYIYVADLDQVRVFSASSTGVLTHLQDVTTKVLIVHLSVNKSFLFGIDYGSGISRFSIGADGRLTPLGYTDATAYVPDYCFASGLLQIDESGSDLHTFMSDCRQNTFLVSFKILPTGDLLFLNRAPADPWASSQLRFTQGNRFAYQTGCKVQVDQQDQIASATPHTAEWRRETTGAMTYLGTLDDVPENKSPARYCPVDLANDPTDHLLFGYMTEFGAPAPNLGVYTADDQGNLSTTNTYKNMTWSETDTSEMSISPTGKLAALGGTDGSGYQFFHFNGANPPTKFTGVYDAGSRIWEFGWDKSDHVYVLSENSLIVWNLTPTSYKQIPDSTYPLKEASSLIVLSR